MSNIADKPAINGIVGVNLTRLISGAKGAGGAGIFSLHLARALAKVAKLHIYVSRDNRGMIEKFVKRNESAFQTASIKLINEDSYVEALETAAASCAVWFDPLNGLEPEVIPESTFSVSVIHDLLFQNHPYFFSSSELDSRTRNYGGSISRADMVITVSDAEKVAIQSRYGTDKVRTLYQPPYYCQVGSAGQVPNDKRILFYPAVQWNHKNHMGLVEAFLSLCENQEIPDDVVLLLSGVVPVEDNTRLYMEAVKKSAHGHRVIEVPYLEAHQYDLVMRSCLGLMFPSLYEGYGIPALEATYSGVPMLTSQVPSLEGVTLPSNIRLISDPESPVQLYESLKQFVLSQPERGQTESARDTSTDVGGFDGQVAAILGEIKEIIAAGKRKRELISEIAWPVVSQKQEGLEVWVALDPKGDLQSASDHLSRFEAELRSNLPQTNIHVRAILGAKHLATGGAAKVSDLPIIYREGAVDTQLSYHLTFCKVATLATIDIHDLSTPSLSGRVAAGYKALNAKTNFNSLSLRAECRAILPSRHYALIEGRMLQTARLKLPLSSTSSQVLDRISRGLRSWQDFEKPGVHVLDPALKDTIGHHIALAKMWVKGANKLGYRTTLAVNSSADIDAYFPDQEVHLLFSDYMYGNIGDIGLFKYELSRAAQACGFRGGDNVFLFCATPAMLAGTAAWLLLQKEADRPVFLIRFDRTQERAPASRLSYSETFDRIRSLGLRKYFKFYTESKGLQAYFRPLSGEDMPLLFNPLPDVAGSRLDELFPSMDRGSAKNSKITLGYLGEARLEKGFQKLPFLVEYLMSIPEIAEKIQFKFQVSIGPQNQVPDVISAKHNLQQMARRYSNIELLDYLSDDEYVRALNSLDLLLLPYDLAQYAIRGSGVATEAIAAEVPMVVSRGLDLAKTFAGVGVVEPTEHSVLAYAQAVKSAIENIDGLKASIRSVKSGIDGFEIEDSAVVQRLINDVQAQNDTFKGLALLLVNDTYGEGNTAVFKSQRRYLEDKGYCVIEMELPYPNDARFTSVGDNIEWNDMMKTLSQSMRFIDTPHYRGVLKKIKSEGHSYEAFWDAWRGLHIPDDLRTLLANNEFACVVINYAHHYGALKNHNLVPNAPLILEAHDIQSYQYAIQQDREPDAREIKEELEKLHQFDHVVSISNLERQAMVEVVGDDKVTWCLPAVDEQKYVLGGQASPSVKKGDYHILFVGSSHEANVASLRWFIQNVYEPILYAEGVKLGIVGNSGQMVNVQHMSDLVTVYGRVPELRPYYEAADVVALPIVMGAGVPIKVLDAFRMNKPFTMHSFPSEAMALPADFPVVDNGMQMAQDILSLLSDSKLAGERAKAGYSYYQNLASPQAFDRIWDKVVDKAREAFDKRVSLN